MIGDHTVFHVVPHWRANPAMMAPSKRNCRIAQRIARTPKRGVRTPSRYAPGTSPSGRCVRSISSAVLCHRIRTGTPAQGASITSTTTRSCPCAITPQPGQPAQRSQDSLSSTRPHSRRAAATRWKPSKSTSRSHRSQRSSDTEQQQQVGDTPPGALEDSGG